MTKEMKTVLAFAGVFLLLALGAVYFVIDTMDAVDEHIGDGHA